MKSVDFLKKCLVIQRLRRPGVKSLAITGQVSVSLGSRRSKRDEDSKFEPRLSPKASTRSGTISPLRRELLGRLPRCVNLALGSMLDRERIRAAGPKP